MRTVVLASSFKRAFKRLVGRQPQLEERIQERLALLTADPFDPLLQTHKLKGKLSGAWACSTKGFERCDRCQKFHHFKQ
ncbi:plasmid stabilization system protein [Nostoc sp. CHAB 5784]|uniref:type II toxin-antitoxin system RelE/ParE family toxin n=1 Tax=Nostoc mirabile TaxID=2907820 RepID=UPI001E5412FC|nr:plasmid stabilization system protein [Nostoc mirabile]MCC5667526.1 plasmid stabilization system protein [Nostoc mirabile CHAB5784]